MTRRQISFYFPKDDKSKNAETSQNPELGANPDESRTLTLHRLFKFLGVSQLQQDKTPRLTMLKNRVTVSQNTDSVGFFLLYKAASGCQKLKRINAALLKQRDC